MDESLTPQADMPQPPEEQLMQPGQPQVPAPEVVAVETTSQATAQESEVHSPINQIESGAGTEVGDDVDNQSDALTSEVGTQESDSTEPAVQPESGSGPEVQKVESSEEIIKAKAQLEEVADRMEKSGDPAAAVAATILRERGTELAKQGKERYEEEKRIFDEARASLLGTIAAVVMKKIDIDPEGIDLLAVKGDEDILGGGLNRSQTSDLRSLVYTALGIEETYGNDSDRTVKTNDGARVSETIRSRDGIGLREREGTSSNGGLEYSLTLVKSF
jgi:hypothetical protein